MRKSAPTPPPQNLYPGGAGISSEIATKKEVSEADVEWNNLKKEPSSRRLRLTCAKHVIVKGGGKGSMEMKQAKERASRARTVTRLPRARFCKGIWRREASKERSGGEEVDRASGALYGS